MYCWQTVRNAMIEASSAVEEKMTYLARIREKKVKKGHCILRRATKINRKYVK